MSKMELRSSRSRSKTPFVTQEFMDREVSSLGNHVEKTVVRTTRRTTVYKSNENASSSTDEINTSRESVSPSSKSSGRKSTSRSERTLRNRLLKTSDYSSEDGENEVSSSRMVRQNERNQLVQDARTLANGSEMPALELYRKSGRYWDVYPKTDWTYSYHSKDRVEIAPGVVAMPNMSRKTIHSLDESGQTLSSFESLQNLYSDNVSHKNTNTENTFTARYSGHLGEEVKKSVYNNNSEDYFIKRRTQTRWSSFKQTVTTIFTSIFTTIFTLFYYSYRVQTAIFSQIHRVASKVMLWDTYLLWKSRPGDKATKLALLCLLPLLLFGGLWLLSGLAGALYGTFSSYTNSTTSILGSLGISGQTKGYEEQLNRFEREAELSSGVSETSVNMNVDSNTPINFGASVDDKQAGYENSFSGSDNKKTIVEEKIVKITEKIYVEPPTASEIAGSFTKEQIEAIAAAVRDSLNINDQRSQVNTEELVEKIVNNPSFVNIVNNYHQAEYQAKESNEARDKPNEELLNKHQVLIESLLKEIENMKQEIILNNKLRSDDYARLSVDIRKCCEKRPMINIEGYVSRIVTDLLNNPEFLRNQKGLNAWLHSLFVAKQDLESRLGNITANMDSKLAAVVESNSQLLMDKVAAKLVEVNKEQADIQYVRHEVTDEAFVKRVVKDALMIYDADRTGLVDYAMESMGGQIVTTRCTEPYHYGKAVVSVLGVPLWHMSNSPRTVITPTIAPGDCWAFQNFPGFVVIKLSNKIKVEAFSMEHISRLLLPEGKMDSAPKEFEVYGLREENDKEPVLLGIYKFEYDGDSLQFFLVEKDNQVFDMIEVRIVSNHGNPNYTCLYRFRVHGKLHHEEGS